MEDSSKAKAYKKACAKNDKYAENYDKIDWGKSTVNSPNSCNKETELNSKLKEDTNGHMETK